MDKRNEKIKN